MHALGCDADECQGGLFKALSNIQDLSSRGLWTGYCSKGSTSTKGWCLLCAAKRKTVT